MTYMYRSNLAVRKPLVVWATGTLIKNNLDISVYSPYHPPDCTTFLRSRKCVKKPCSGYLVSSKERVRLQWTDNPLEQDPS